MKDEPKIKITNDYVPSPGFLDLYAKSIDPVKVIEDLKPPHAVDCCTPSQYTSWTYDKLLQMIEDIHSVVCTHVPTARAVDILTHLLDERKCPTDNCKNCQYYTPGKTEPCDTNKAIAEYLIHGDYIKVNRPKTSEE